VGFACRKISVSQDFRPVSLGWLTQFQKGGVRGEQGFHQFLIETAGFWVVYPKTTAEFPIMPTKTERLKESGTIGGPKRAGHQQYQQQAQVLGRRQRLVKRGEIFLYASLTLLL
jgi:hypothetical protein